MDCSWGHWSAFLPLWTWVAVFFLSGPPHPFISILILTVVFHPGEIAQSDKRKLRVTSLFSAALLPCDRMPWHWRPSAPLFCTRDHCLSSRTSYTESVMKPVFSEHLSNKWMSLFTVTRHGNGIGQSEELSSVHIGICTVVMQSVLYDTD